MSKVAIASAAELSAYAPFAARLRGWSSRSTAYLRGHALTILELALILAWAIIVVRPYLNFDPMVVPAGREYLHHLHSNHIWTRAQSCGLCALWNGSVRGGYPGFADVQSSALHPFVIVPTLLFGVINGAKVMLLLAFFTAGLAQWWLGRTIGLSRPVRTWTALMAIGGGHLAGRMEGGVPGVVLALASCSLALAALLDLVGKGTRRSAVLFGVALALALLAGQGYIQIGFALLLPLAAVLIFRGPVLLSLVGRRLLTGVGLALLLAAPLILPTLRFLPEFAKNIDPQFAAAQPLKYTLLNLLVDDGGYYRTEVLHKMAFPAIYAFYIGWIPFLLAIWGLASRSVTGSARHGIFFGVTALGALWLATSAPLAWLAHTLRIPALPGFIYGVRFTPLFTGLAVPPILALAGIGVVRLLSSRWPQFNVGLGSPDGEAMSVVRIDLRWLVIIPLVLALRESYIFGRLYIRNTPLSEGMGVALDALKTLDLQWVNPPFGEQYWMEGAVARNLKVSTGTQGWSWAEREPPLPVLELSHGDLAPDGMRLVGQVEDLNLFAAGPGREYASVTGVDGSRTACVAVGTGGDIDVSCETPGAGVLTVQENFWPGWQASVDGKPASVNGAPFIKVLLSPGAHTVTLRYRPWDALLGIGLCLVGVCLAIYLWLAKDPDPAPGAEVA